MNIDTMSLAEMLVKEQSEEVLKNYHQRIRQHIYSLENVHRDLSDSIAYGLDANDILVNLTQAIDFLIQLTEAGEAVL